MEINLKKVIEDLKVSIINIESLTSVHDIELYLKQKHLKNGLCYYVWKKYLSIIAYNNMKKLTEPYSRGDAYIGGCDLLTSLSKGKDFLLNALQLRIDILEKIIKQKEQIR